jgi:hypothetical protein
MGVDVATVPVLAFAALFLAPVLIIGVVVARRRGALRSRGSLIAVGIVVALLLAFGMTGGFLPDLGRCRDGSDPPSLDATILLSSARA